MISSINNNLFYHQNLIENNLKECQLASEQTSFGNAEIENTNSKEQIENSPFQNSIKMQIGLMASIALFLLGTLVSIGLFCGGFGYPMVILAIAATTAALLSSLILIKKIYDTRKVEKIISLIDFNSPQLISNSLKKCVILSSEGGGGHKAATEAIRAHLRQKNMEAVVFYPIGEQKIFGFSGESFYNFLLTHNYIRVINWLGCFLAPLLFRVREEKTKAIITKCLQKENPDLLVSVIPYINYPASEAARVKKIPFLLITTDNDLTHWVDRLDKMTHPNVRITIGHNRFSTRGLLEDKGISADGIQAIGLPLRSTFEVSVDKKELLAKHGVPPKSSVVLIMMGAVGAEITYQYVKELADFSNNFHLIVCTGRNASLAKRLETLPLADGNSMKIVPFTNEIHELMAICDLVITKAGSISVTEAMAQQLPIILDRTSTPLKWERANIEIVEENEIGKAVYSIKELTNRVAELLNNRKQIKRNYSFISMNRFNEELPRIIQELIPDYSDIESIS